MDFLHTINISLRKFFKDLNNFLNQLKGFRWSYQNWKWKTEKETCWKRKNVEWTTTRAQARKSIEVRKSKIQKGFEIPKFGKFKSNYFVKCNHSDWLQKTAGTMNKESIFIISSWLGLFLTVSKGWVIHLSQMRKAKTTCN